MALLTLLWRSPEPKKAVLMEAAIPEGIDGPFLVTSTKGFVWVPKVSRASTIRSAIQKKERLNTRMVLEVERKSEELGWGSVSTATAKGVKAVLEHLQYYGFAEVEALVGEGFDTSLLKGTPYEEVDWVPDDYAVLLPIDRSFVGVTYDFGVEGSAVVLHNPSRGIGIVRPV